MQVSAFLSALYKLSKSCIWLTTGFFFDVVEILPPAVGVHRFDADDVQVIYSVSCSVSLFANAEYECGNNTLLL